MYKYYRFLFSGVNIKNLLEGSLLPELPRPITFQQHSIYRSSNSFDAVRQMDYGTASEFDWNEQIFMQIAASEPFPLENLTA
jgi:hypothetical protein